MNTDVMDMGYVGKFSKNSWKIKISLDTKELLFSSVYTEVLTLRRRFAPEQICRHFLDADKKWP